MDIKWITCTLSLVFLCGLLHHHTADAKGWVFHCLFNP